MFDLRLNWKSYLIILGIVILGISSVYTWFLSHKLKEGEETSVKLYAKAIEDISRFDPNDNTDLTLQTQLTLDFKIPSILVDSKGRIISGYNFGKSKDLDTTFLRNELEKIKRTNLVPVEVQYLNQFVYYKNSNLYILLSYFPYFQFILLSLFIGLGYLGITLARKSEQNQLWVGMAKETAHQLGTPLSAIFGWIEYLKESFKENADQSDIIKELENDVLKVKTVADRFSKIGSAPKLNPENIFSTLERARYYMERRAPKRIQFNFPKPELEKPIYVSINIQLFEWVIENLIRNALDAMEDKGVISAAVSQNEKFVQLDIQDTGKGINQSSLKKVFNPGFSTKQRGWGLGLSLSKRIISDYHGGKIFVKKSELGMGTTFTILLPRVN